MGWCRRCGREIRWIETTDGDRFAIDPAPLNDGTLMLLVSGKARELTEAQRATCPAPLYRRHSASCQP